MNSLASFLRLLPVFVFALASQALLAQPPSPTAFAGKRLALVVGNGQYPSAPLKNPVNDAKAMARTLKDLGFEVTLRENAGQRDLAAAIRQFGSSLTPGSAALFYFAGHGMQVKGRNYLVPTDADIQLEDEVPYAALDVSLVLDKMEVGKSAINIVILDACRNNPFARRFRSSSTGLAQMDAPIGTLIAFATAPGSVAQDGTGENGIYTKHLLESIAMPGLPVEQMFKRVRVGVAKDTHEAQVPWESSSMKGDFVFKEAPKQLASQDRMIEEAVRVAAERAATLTAERMRREQAGYSSQADRAKADQEAIATEREKLQRERERLEAERAALRKEAPPPAPVAMAAPTAAASPPVPRKQASPGALPEVGDRWTYRYSDGYGKTLDYTVRVTTVSNETVADELSRGKARLPGRFEPGLEFASRLVEGVSIREASPYLQGFGALAEADDWKKVSVPGGGDNFRARLAGRETVKVPAGEFEAGKVVIEGQLQVGQIPRQLTIEVWYAPAAKRFVKMAFSAPHFTNNPAEREVIELIETSLPLPATVAATKSPAAVASLAPVADAEGAPPRAGDSWTYRFSDSYGKSEAYTVRVTASAGGAVEDEARLGKARHAATHEAGLAISDRKLGTLALREISPYLMNHGQLRETPEWKGLNIFEGSPPFTARLAGSETVTVPAGSFEAQKLVIEGRQRSQRFYDVTRNYTITAWYAPAARRFVKLSFDAPAQGHIFPAERETIELLEYRLQ